MTPPSPSPTPLVTQNTITDRNTDMTNTTTETAADETFDQVELTDEIDLTEAPEAVAEAVTETAQPATEPEQGQEQEGGSREAAKYRKQLRSVEAERDQLRTDLDNLRRAEIGRQAEAAGIKTAALWASGATLESLLGEDGTPDTARVLEAVATARTVLGLYQIPVAPSADGQGKVGIAIPLAPETTGWEGAFKPKE